VKALAALFCAESLLWVEAKVSSGSYSVPHNAACAARRQAKRASLSFSGRAQAKAECCPSQSSRIRSATRNSSSTLGSLPADRQLTISVLTPCADISGLSPLRRRDKNYQVLLTCSEAVGSDELQHLRDGSFCVRNGCKRDTAMATYRHGQA
jgi:hypothetical protein